MKFKKDLDEVLTFNKWAQAKLDSLLADPVVDTCPEDILKLEEEVKALQDRNNGSMSKTTSSVENFLFVTDETKTAENVADYE